MTIVFYKCHVCTKELFLNLNKLAFYPSFIIFQQVKLLTKHRVLGGCRIEQLSQNYASSLSLINFASEGFQQFCKIK